jgi:hypothetical protein
VPATATTTPTLGCTTGNNTTTTLATTPPTTNVNNARVISIVGEDQSTTSLTLSAAAGFTRENAVATSSNGLSFGIADLFLANAGTAGTPTWSSSPTPAHWISGGVAFH